MILILFIVFIVIITLLIFNRKETFALYEEEEEEAKLEILYDNLYLIFKPNDSLKKSLPVFTIYIERLDDPSTNFQVIRFIPSSQMSGISVNPIQKYKDKDMNRHEHKDGKDKHVGNYGKNDVTKIKEIETKLTTLDDNNYHRIYVECTYNGKIVKSNTLVIPPVKYIPKYDSLKNCDATLKKYPDRFPNDELYKSIFL